MRRVCVFREALSRSLGEEASECQVRKEWARLKGRTQACVDLEAGLCAGSAAAGGLALGSRARRTGGPVGVGRAARVGGGLRADERGRVWAQQTAGVRGQGLVAGVLRLGSRARGSLILAFFQRGWWSVSAAWLVAGRVSLVPPTCRWCGGA